MIFCFSGTGNSRYIARRFAEALQDTIIDLNAKIKAQDNSLIQTGRDCRSSDICMAYSAGSIRMAY